MHGDAVTMLTMTPREVDTALGAYGVTVGLYGLILAAYYPGRLRRNREEAERGRPVIQRLAVRLDAHYEPAHQSDLSLMFNVPRFGVLTGQQDRLTFTLNPSSQGGGNGGYLFLTVEPVRPLHFEFGPKRLSLELDDREYDDLAQVLGARSARRYDPTTAALLLALARNAKELRADQQRILVISRFQNFRWDQDLTGELAMASWVRESLATCRGLLCDPGR